MSIKTPVVLLIFKRPDTTQKVFDVVRQVQPSKLWIIADGPRNEEEAEKCDKTRSIVEKVDWDCEVIKDYSETNLGLKYRVSSGLDAVFKAEEEAIILEDDCVPDPSFFRFCEELLEKYRYDSRVMMINGTNILEQWKSEQQSYHFAYLSSCWGWATWRRAWEYYDINMKLWKEPEVQQRIKDVICNVEQANRFEKIFTKVYNDKSNSWAYRFLFARLLQSGLTIIPSKNLVTNIGFSENSTHTKVDLKKVGNMKTYSMQFPLKYPYGVTVDRNYDFSRFKKTKLTLRRRVTSKLKRILENNP